MNQILFIQDKKRNNPEDTKKIVLFFAVVIIIFGLILFGQGVYAVYKNNAKKDVNVKSENEMTQIQLSQIEGGKILITVESQTAISELIYFWNSEASNTISENGKTTIQETIEAPVGENTLTVKTIDMEGREASKQQLFTLNVEKPTINLSLIGDNIKIIVNSKTELSYITYQWNSDKEEKIDMVTYEDKTTLEKEIEIPVGQNTLKVVAVDTYDNKSEKSLEVRGVKKPTIDNPKLKDGVLYFEVVADEEIKEIIYFLNDKNYIINSDVIKNAKKFKYQVKLDSGTNVFKISATTVSGVNIKKMWTIQK